MVFTNNRTKAIMPPLDGVVCPCAKHVDVPPVEGAAFHPSCSEVLKQFREILQALHLIVLQKFEGRLDLVDR